jgi:hypothetical protein
MTNLALCACRRVDVGAALTVERTHGDRRLDQALFRWRDPANRVDAKPGKTFLLQKI